MESKTSEAILSCWHAYTDTMVNNRVSVGPMIPQIVLKEWPGQLSTPWTWQNTYEPIETLHPVGSAMYPFEAGT